MKLLLAATEAITLRAFLRPFAEEFRGMGWTVDGLAHGVSAMAGDLREFNHLWDVPLSRSVIAVPQLLVSVRGVREVVLRERYDLVHVHTPVAAFVVRYALRKWRTRHHGKIIYTAHGFHFVPGRTRPSDLLFRTLERAAGRWTDRLVVINDDDYRQARRLGIVDEERLQHIPGIGVDTARLDPRNVSADAVAAFRRSLAIGEDDPVFLMVAEFNPGKRHRDALHAFARIREPRAHLLLAGEGRCRPDVESMAAQLGVSDRVHFLGYRQDVPVLMRASLATLMPSEREGLSRSVMESLSLAVPVIGSAVRGVKDLVDADCGRVVPLGDVAAMNDAMAWMIGHRGEAERMGMRGRLKMCRFDLKVVLEAYRQLYLKAVATPA